VAASATGDGGGGSPVAILVLLCGLVLAAVLWAYAGSSFAPGATEEP
jgi:hypothetical protein